MLDVSAFASAKCSGRCARNPKQSRAETSETPPPPLPTCCAARLLPTRGQGSCHCVDVCSSDGGGIADLVQANPSKKHGDALLRMLHGYGHDDGSASKFQR